MSIAQTAGALKLAQPLKPQVLGTCSCCGAPITDRHAARLEDLPRGNDGKVIMIHPLCFHQPLVRQDAVLQKIAGEGVALSP